MGPKKPPRVRSNFYSRKVMKSVENRADSRTETESKLGPAAGTENRAGASTEIENTAGKLKVAENKLMFERINKTVQNSENSKRKSSSQEVRPAKKPKNERDSVTMESYEQSLLDLYR